MSVYSFKTTQVIPASLDKAWEFFSSPYNLRFITPPSVRFDIISRHSGDKMYPGQLIEYTLRPFLNIPFYWMTEITHVQEKVFFVDEQRYGPYSMWHHQHHFKEVKGGIEMTDIVHYKIPGWWLGRLINRIYVQKELKKIFHYRQEKIAELFKAPEA